MMRIRPVVTPLLLGLYSATSSAAPASDAASVERLPAMVVTPTRSEKAADSTPFSVASLDAGRLQGELMSRTTPEALRDIPSVLVQRTAHGQGSPFIRGFTGYHTLFLMDGVRLNNSTFRSGPNPYWGTVDSFSYERLELLKGPAAALYGSDAVGGVAQAITADPFVTAGESGFSGRLHARAASAEHSLTGRAEVSAADETTALRAGLTLRDYGDLEAGGGVRQHKTGYEEWAGDVALALKLAEKVRLDAVHQSLRQDDAWRTHGTLYGTSFRGTTVGKDKARVLDQDRYLTYARLSGADLDGTVKDVSLTLSHQRQDEREFRVRKDETGQYQGVEVDTLGVQAQATVRQGEMDITFGVDYFHDSVDSFSRRQKEAGGDFKNAIQGPVADDASYDSLGIFIQDDLELTADTSALLGARYTHASATAGKYQDTRTGDAARASQSWDNASFSGRLSHEVSRVTLLYTGVSQGFRAPNLSDLTRLDTARSDEVEVPSLDLDPEKFLSFEVGARVTAERCSGSVALYHTLVDGLIQRTPTGEVVEDGRVVRKTNSGDGYVQGVEAGASAELNEMFSTRGGIGWMQGRVDSYATAEPVLMRDDMSRMMPLSGYLALRCIPAATAWIELVFSAGADQPHLSASDRLDTERIPPKGNVSYEVFTLRGRLEVIEDLGLTLAIENLFDREYRTLGSGVTEPGRNFVAALDYRF